MTNTNNYSNIPQKKNSYAIPASIVIAGLLIAGAVFYSQGNSPAPADNAVPRQSPPSDFGSSADNIKPVSSKDHIRGNPDAPVKFVEFSDFECPFCKSFHPTMQQIMNEYGKSGQVAWIYRHFPLDQLHSKARKEAAATECANELGGNAKFWEYVDGIFEITPSNDRLDLTLLSQIAEDIGLNRSQFDSCLAGGKYAKHIEDNFQDAIASGGNGTPYSVIIAPNGKKFPLSGAQPYSAVKSIIELALKEK